MPQIGLPIFSEGCTDISRDVGFEKRGGMVCYFTGQLPVFTHAEAQALLDQGWAVPAVSQELGVLQSTLHKAIGAGRLVKKKALSATRER